MYPTFFLPEFLFGAAGRCFPTYFALPAESIEFSTLLTTLISFNKGKRGVDSLPNIYHVPFAINLENTLVKERWG